MSWVCENQKCLKVSKGFAKGRTHCHVCRRCAELSQERLNRLVDK